MGGHERRVGRPRAVYGHDAARYGRETVAMRQGRCADRSRHGSNTVRCDHGTDGFTHGALAMRQGIGRGMEAKRRGTATVR